MQWGGPWIWRDSSLELAAANELGTITGVSTTRLHRAPATAWRRLGSAPWPNMSRVSAEGIP